MRVLHTSDWHLGQHFMGKSRQAEHQALIDWLVATVEAREVDAVVVAGDIFDTGAPPSYARELYNQCVVRLHQLGVSLVLIGGNHDSVAVLEEGRALLARLGARVVAAASPVPEVFQLNDRHGRPGLVLGAVPFLRPRDLSTSQAGQSAEDKQLALQTAISAYYQHTWALAQGLATREGKGLPILLTGHLTTVGASSSESVREIYVGALEAFPTAAFPPADYIALGHIHRPQKVGGCEHIRYSGAPLALSFDELAPPKQMNLVNFSEGRLAGVEAIPVPIFQPMLSLRGNLKTLADALPRAAAGVTELPAMGGEPVRLWLELTIEGDAHLSDLPARVQALAADLPVDVLRIKRAREASAISLTAPVETLDELSPEEVFLRCFADGALLPELEGPLLERYRQVLAHLRDEAADTAPASGAPA